MGLDCDTCLYDLIARRVMAGDVHYRDLLDVNLPGIVWLHMLFRSIVGWSSEALRAVDFAIIASSVFLLSRCLPQSVPAWGRVATAGVLLTFYLSTSEYCHCQRDPWMLLPCLLALRLRGRQTNRLVDRDSSGLFRWALAEGIVWGSAVWIKPYAIIPALACWLVSTRIVSGTPGAWKRLGRDLAGLLTGGLLVGGLGMAWLVSTGAWADFVDIIFRWNGEYLRFKPFKGPWWIAPLGLIIRQFPWILLHIAAVPIAVVTVWNGGRRGLLPPLMAAFYLGWLFQAVVLQHCWDYVHTVPIMLAIAVLALDAAESRGGSAFRSLLLLAGCTVWTAVIASAHVSVPNWTQCATEGSNPETRDRVGRIGRLDWREQSRVSAFLKEQNAGEDEISVFSTTLVSLYNDLNIRPASRFCFLHQHLVVFESRGECIRNSLVASRQRFLVCDLKGNDQLRESVERGRSDPPCCRQDRVAFRAGNYVVLLVEGREMPAWLDVNMPPEN